MTDDGQDGAASRLVAAASREPVYIADGHHRYETALRYRDERRMTRSCEPDPPFDFLLALFLDADDALTVLPTHRVVRGLGEEGLARLRGGLGDLFEVAPTTADALVDALRRRRRARRRRGPVRAPDAGRAPGCSPRAARRSSR